MGNDDDMMVKCTPKLIINLQSAMKYLHQLYCQLSQTSKINIHFEEISTIIGAISPTFAILHVIPVLPKGDSDYLPLVGRMIYGVTT